MSEKIKKIIKKWKKLIDSKLRNFLSINKSKMPKELYKAMNYAVFPGGKRIRPILAMASAYACGLSVKKIISTACAIELIHSYSLVHDDLPSMDNDDFRRNKPTVWAKFGKSIAECIGLDYAAAIFQAVNKSKYSLEISEILAQT
ncbi:MAG: polyprenyl synthetase family protein, partial [Endomicrobiia bacterium]